MNDKEKQDRFDCKHLECCMDGCYCKAGHGHGYGHCVIPYKQATCKYFERNPKTRTVKINENEVVISKTEYKRLKSKRYIITPKQVKSEEVSNLLIPIQECEIKPIPSEEEIRKETAREVLELLVPDCERCDENWHKGCLCLRATLAEKIAKQFGVEIGE